VLYKFLLNIIMSRCVKSFLLHVLSLDIKIDAAMFINVQDSVAYNA